MNGKGGPASPPPAAIAAGTLTRQHAVAALEAMEAGDTAEAVAILLSALEDGSRARRYACACGSRFQWPGLLEHHRLMSGHELPEAA